VKRCTRCGETKPLDQMLRHKRTRDGFSSWCRACHAASNRRWRAEHRAYQDAYNARRRMTPLPERVCVRCGSTYAPVRSDQRRCRKACGRMPRPHDSARTLWRNLKLNATRVDRPRPIRPSPFRRWASGLDARWAYYGGRCWMCGDPATEWDHVKPLAAGGHPSLLANLRPMCGPCNVAKGSSWFVHVSAGRAYVRGRDEILVRNEQYHVALGARALP
jgi:hypothetical protein